MLLIKTSTTVSSTDTLHSDVLSPDSAGGGLCCERPVESSLGDKEVSESQNRRLIKTQCEPLLMGRPGRTANGALMGKR